MLEIIPVIDLMNSVAVSGKSGNRSEYTPLETIYASSANPVEIASSLKLAGAKEMYIADLNFIERDGSHNINEINDVNRILPVIADIGVDNLNTFEFALKYAYKIIVATETLESIDELMKIFEKYPKERIIVSVDVKNNEFIPRSIVGIDLGIKTLATCSNGIKCIKPNIKKDKKKLKRLQKQASRHYQEMIDISKRTKTKFSQLPKSKNLLKLESEIRKTYRRINNKCMTNIHEFTSSIVKLNPQAVIIEDLNVDGMRKNKYLSEKINEAKFYEIRRQLTYKCDWNNIELIIADRWYPSSKICSSCGHKKDKLSLSERTYVCEKCGCIIDRDYNASLNLKYLAL